MGENWLDLLQSGNQLAKVVETNQYTEKFGLVLTEEEAGLIIDSRISSLRDNRRVEFGEGIAPKLIKEFCDSQYINQDNYAQTIIRLQDIFYLYKNEMNDEITDDELLHLMKEMFEELCYGDLEYLETTGLADFAEAVRAGYDGYADSDGYGESSRFSLVAQWNHDLYVQALEDIFWR